MSSISNNDEIKNSRPNANNVFLSMNEKLIHGYVRCDVSKYRYLSDSQSSVSNRYYNYQSHSESEQLRTDSRHVSVDENKQKSQKKHPDKQLYMPPTHHKNSAGKLTVSVSDAHQGICIDTTNLDCLHTSVRPVSETVNSSNSNIVKSHTKKRFSGRSIDIPPGTPEIKPNVLTDSEMSYYRKSPCCNSSDETYTQIMNKEYLGNIENDSVFTEFSLSATKKRKASTSPQAGMQSYVQVGKNSQSITRKQRFFPDNTTEERQYDLHNHEHTNIVRSKLNNASINYEPKLQLCEPPPEKKLSSVDTLPQPEASALNDISRRPIRFSMLNSKSCVFLPRPVIVQQRRSHLTRPMNLTPVALKAWRSQPDIIHSPVDTNEQELPQCCGDIPTKTITTKSNTAVRLSFPPNNHTSRITSYPWRSLVQPTSSPILLSSYPVSSSSIVLPSSSPATAPNTVISSSTPLATNSLRASQLNRVERLKFAHQTPELRKKYCTDKNLIDDLIDTSPVQLSPLSYDYQQANIFSPIDDKSGNNSPTLSDIHSPNWSTQLRERCRGYRTGYVDSHCHIDFLFNRLSFRGSFLQYRRNNSHSFPDNYEGCVAVFCSPFSFKPYGLWTKLSTEEGIWLAFGCHPKFAEQYSDAVEENLRYCLRHTKVVAAGEFGLDYSRHFHQFKTMQQSVFIRQLKIAIELHLPLVIHCREAEDDTFNIMKEHVPRDVRIHRHCFTEDMSEAQRWLDYFPNLFIGLTNVVSFPTAGRVHEVARYIPLDRLLLETDAPYFKPRAIPSGREENYSHPGMAVFVAEEVARIRQVSVVEVLRACRENTRQMYSV